MDGPPRLGDVVGMPAWMRVGPVRVLDVRVDPVPGLVQVDGYEINRTPREQRTFRVPLVQLRRLPDPTYGGSS